MGKKVPSKQDLATVVNRCQFKVKAARIFKMFLTTLRKKHQPDSLIQYCTKQKNAFEL